MMLVCRSIPVVLPVGQPGQGLNIEYHARCWHILPRNNCIFPSPTSFFSFAETYLHLYSAVPSLDSTFKRFAVEQCALNVWLTDVTPVPHVVARLAVDRTAKFVRTPLHVIWFNSCLRQFQRRWCFSLYSHVLAFPFPSTPLQRCAVSPLAQSRLL